MDVKEEIKNRINIVDLVSLYVKLNSTGKNYKGLCPFHNEKTPSFFVNPEKNSFACYGCNRFGDIFTFVQEAENLNFPQSIDFLIDKFSLNISRGKFKKATSNKEKEEILRINRLSLDYYKNVLYSNEGKKALNYLLYERKISKDDINVFELGFALDQWDGLSNFLSSKSISFESAQKAGLLIKGKSGKFYDRFRGRIIIPVFSHTGDIIAFGGRTFIDDSAKYINSPETLIYKKSQHLFGLDKSKSYIREEKKAYLVEGYFDMIALYKNGIRNCVATLGTALTGVQANLIHRFADEVNILYDSDKAGKKAALRAAEIMLINGVKSKVILLHDAKDPDEFLMNQGVEALKKIGGVDIFDFLLEEKSKNYNIQEPLEKSKAINEILSVVSKIDDDIRKNSYLDRLSLFFSTPRRYLDTSVLNTVFSEEEKDLEISPGERILIRTLLYEPCFIPYVHQAIDNRIFDIITGANIIKAIVNGYNAETKRIESMNDIFKLLNNKEQKLLREIFIRNENADTPEMEQLKEDFKCSVISLEEKLKKKKIELINIKIKQALSKNNKKLYMEMLEEKQTLLLNKKYFKEG